MIRNKNKKMWKREDQNEGKDMEVRMGEERQKKIREKKG